MSLSDSACLVADWPAPGNVRTLLTTRQGGVSGGAYASLNLGAHVGDDSVAVAANRERLAATLAARSAGAPVWLNQVHGTRIINAALVAGVTPPEADGSFSRNSQVVCAVMTADCLPVLFCDVDGTVVAAAHAGWRGLLAGVLEASIVAMRVPGEELIAYLGPAIGPQAFEVGDEVKAAFVARSSEAAVVFRAGKPGKWFADLELLARQRLQAAGVTSIYGGGLCTFSDSQRFFSYRRDGQTGRLASLICLV